MSFSIVGSIVALVILLAVAFEIYRYVKSHPQALSDLEVRVTHLENVAEADYASVAADVKKLLGWLTPVTSVLTPVFSGTAAGTVTGTGVAQPGLQPAPSPPAADGQAAATAGYMASGTGGQPAAPVAQGPALGASGTNLDLLHPAVNPFGNYNFTFTGDGQGHTCIVFTVSGSAFKGITYSISLNGMVIVPPTQQGIAGTSSSTTFPVPAVVGPLVITVGDFLFPVGVSFGAQVA